MAQRQQQPIVTSLLIAGLSVLLAAKHFVADLHLPILFLFKAASQPITLVTLVVFVLFAIWSRQKMIVAAVVFACIIQIPFLMPNLAPTKTDVLANSARFTVATFSTLTRTQNVADILAFIESEKPDLLCLQEVSQTDRTSLLNKLRGYYPHTVQSNNNQLTLSRYALKQQDNSGHSQANLIDHPDWGQIGVINVHMPRPYLSNKLFASWRKLFQLIDEHPRTILCGDLNTTPNNSLYHVLSYDYKLNDSLTSGYGFTFPNAQRKSSLLGPLVRIDYIFTRGFHANNTRTINASELSDHRAVLTELTLIN